jgi:hypothetical protein
MRAWSTIVASGPCLGGAVAAGFALSRFLTSSAGGAAELLAQLRAGETNFLSVEDRRPPKPLG